MGVTESIFNVVIFFGTPLIFVLVLFYLQARKHELLKVHPQILIEPKSGLIQILESFQSVKWRFWTP